MTKEAALATLHPERKEASRFRGDDAELDAGFVS
jgi:hypothetical protein